MGLPAVLAGRHRSRLPHGRHGPGGLPRVYALRRRGHGGPDGPAYTPGFADQPQGER